MRDDGDATKKGHRVRTAPVRHGRKYQSLVLDPQSADLAIKAKLSTFGMSEREQEVGLWVVHGLSNRTIAARLCIAEETVKDHLKSVFRKMVIRRRSEIAATLLFLHIDDGEKG